MKIMKKIPPVNNYKDERKQYSVKVFVTSSTVTVDLCNTKITHFTEVHSQHLRTGGVDGT